LQPEQGQAGKGKGRAKKDQKDLVKVKKDSHLCHPEQGKRKDRTAQGWKGRLTKIQGQH
jgi:hypothetical protein